MGIRIRQLLDLLLPARLPAFCPGTIRWMIRAELAVGLGTMHLRRRKKVPIRQYSGFGKTDGSTKKIHNFIRLRQRMETKTKCQPRQSLAKIRNECNIPVYIRDRTVHICLEFYQRR